MKIAPLLILLAFCYPSIGTCGVKPLPPPQLTKIMEYLEGVEGHFKYQEWSGAIEDLNMANSLTDEILANLNKHTNYVILNTFRGDVFNLKQQLINEHYENVKEAYICLCMAFFILNDSYNRTPPLFLDTIGHSIEESKESLEKEEFKHLSYEMDEVSKFVESFGAILHSHGIALKEIEDFTHIASLIKKAAARQDIVKIEEELEKLEKLYAFFVKKY